MVTQRSARDSRAGDGSPAITNFSPFVRRGAECGTRGVVRSPILAAALCAVSLVLARPSGFAAEVIPPKPDRYFNDYAQVVPSATAQQLNDQLAQFERDTSSQVVVAVFPKMQSDSSVEDYAQRIAQSWGVGQKDRRNGVVLLVFVNDRKISIQVGYGLEGALPDAIAYDIRTNQITPRFRQGDYAGGLTAGVNSIEQAIRGEYKGSGQTVAERNRKNGGRVNYFPILIFFIILMIIMSRQKRRGYRYSGLGGPYIGGWGGGSGGGWSSGGGGGSFGGFSGGGGSFGGGGSSGGW